MAGDLLNSAALQALLEDCDALVHCAGSVRGSSLEQFRQTNTRGTATLLSACETVAPGARLLLVSTLAAREPQLSWYARSKREGEDRVKASSLDWCVLRPPAVYGPGDEEMKAIFDMMRRGVALVPGDVQARNSLVHVADLVTAMLACLESAKTSGQVLEVCDSKAGGYDWQELADAAAEVFQRRVRLLHPPAPLLNAVAWCNLAMAKLSGRAPMLTPMKLNELRFPNWVASNAAISGATGWSPETSLRDGLRALCDSAL